MAYYNANEMVRLTRRAKGITQLELCQDICDVATLSKIENGHCGVKKSLYRKLMERMGRITEKRYAVCVDKNGMLSNDWLEWERAYKDQDHENAERYLRKMRENASDSLLTRQYLARAEALIAYRRGRITIEEMMIRIDKALCMTVPRYETYLGKKRVFPFTMEELMALMSLGNGYCRMGDTKKGLRMYEAIRQCLQAGYIGDPDNTELFVTVGYNVQYTYSALGKHMESLVEIEYCLERCRERDFSRLLAKLIFSKAHNYVRLVEKGIWEKGRMEEAKDLLQQAYDVATARGEQRTMQIIREYYKQHCGEA